MSNEKDILGAYHSGKLFDEVFDLFGLLDEAAIESTTSKCVDLHNAGQINLLLLIDNPRFQSIEGFRFFVGQHFFCDVIPRLASPVDQMISAVRALVAKGGQDLAANAPNDALVKWLKADLARAREVVTSAKAGNQDAVDSLTFALLAGQMTDEAMDFIKSYSDTCQVCGIVALGRMRDLSDAISRRALSAILRAISGDADERLLANALMSVLDIVEKNPSLTCKDAIEIVRRVCQQPTPQVLFFLARSLWVHHKTLCDDAMSLLFRALMSVDPAHKGTIKELDLGLQKLLKTTTSDEAVEFLGNLLVSREGSLSLSDFPICGRELFHEPNDRTYRTFISWMLRGDHVLCDDIEDFLKGEDLSGRPLDLPIDSLKLSLLEQLFICRKVIGYLFLRPVTAASVLVSVLRSSDQAEATDVCNLLFDPMLINYGGSVKEYLQSLPNTDKAYPHVQVALARNDEYLNSLGAVGIIKELRPSEHQRQIEHERFHDQMRKARKDAEKNSVFLSMVTRSTILYGKRSLTYFEGPDSKSKPVEMELQSHGISIEVPRMDIVDPVGLDFMLRVFRAERLAREANNS